ncbi:PREDICTED: F-box [Prunus dulcis]|uniref:PREDICTED: F-box n=1 Tax=Prunus dulcis TaxID=3755 RepID=A0A5E4G4A9_PRUDU|nr:PREDICTED: F-box [Prunus dulcis]
MADKLHSAPLKYVANQDAVCPSWNKAVKYISQLPSSLACLPEPPWIVLHKYDDDVEFRFRTLKGKIYHLKDPPGKLGHADVICPGSSYGWLLFLRNKEQKQLRPLLLNPLSGTQLLLPSFQTCPHIISITYPKIPTRIGHAYCRIKSNK